MELRTAQRLAWDNVIAKGFDTEDVPREFLLLHGELAEAFDAWRRDSGGLADELADVAIYLMSLATMTGIDLESAVEAKMAENARRVYARDPRTGVHVRVEGERSGVPADEAS